VENDNIGYQWPFNSRYTQKDSGCYSYAAVVFSPFVVLKNDSESMEIPPPPSYTIDTIYVAFSHENNSGTNDTLILKITNIDNNGMPGSTVIWKDVFTTGKGLSKNNDWKNGYTHRLYRPGLEMKGKSFALVFEYFGDKRDTLGFRSIYKQDSSKSQIHTINGKVYPAVLPKYKKTNWMTGYPKYQKITSSAELSYRENKGYTVIQHWDFYVRISVK
jgi:hypothetical protein